MLSQIHSNNSCWYFYSPVALHCYSLIWTNIIGRFHVVFGDHSYTENLWAELLEYIKLSLTRVFIFQTGVKALRQDFFFLLERHYCSTPLRYILNLTFSDSYLIFSKYNRSNKVTMKGVVVFRLCKLTSFLLQ